MKNYHPYKNYSNNKLKILIIEQAKQLEVNKYIYKLIDMAFNDEAWNPRLDFNGCNVVQDKFHPDISCFLHDWLWNTGKGGMFSNELFYDIMIDIGYRECVAKRRYLAVSLAWKLVYRFKKRKKSIYSIEDVKKNSKHIINY